MNCLLYKHKDLIFKLFKLRKNKSKLLNLIKNLKNYEIKTIGELSHNILKGGVVCTNYRKRQLKPYTNTLRLLGDKKISLIKKKSALLRGKGILLSTLAPLGLSVISNLLGEYIKK